MKKEWSEEQAHFIQLPVDDVEIVNKYLVFTYGRDLPTQTIQFMPGGGISQWELLVKVYVLGDRRLEKCAQRGHPRARASLTFTRQARY
jgi:hypothetical protein